VRPPQLTTASLQAALPAITCAVRPIALVRRGGKYNAPTLRAWCTRCGRVYVTTAGPWRVKQYAGCAACGKPWRHLLAYKAGERRC
jgi:hypothetical protein